MGVGVSWGVITVRIVRRLYSDDQEDPYILQYTSVFLPHFPNLLFTDFPPPPSAFRSRRLITPKPLSLMGEKPHDPQLIAYTAAAYRLHTVPFTLGRCFHQRSK